MSIYYKACIYKVEEGSKLVYIGTTLDFHQTKIDRRQNFPPKSKIKIIESYGTKQEPEIIKMDLKAKADRLISIYSPIYNSIGFPDIQYKKKPLTEYNQNYRKQNLEKLNAKKREKICCKFCESILSRGSMYIHRKNHCSGVNQ